METTRPPWSKAELDAQSQDVLPVRETLTWDVNITNVVAVNVAIAVNAATIASTATAAASQYGLAWHK